MTPEQLARSREKDSLVLSRTRVLHDLETAANPRYREILQKALEHLNQRLTEI